MRQGLKTQSGGKKAAGKLSSEGNLVEEAHGQADEIVQESGKSECLEQNREKHYHHW